MIPTPEQAWGLLCEFNEGAFHRKHAEYTPYTFVQTEEELAKAIKRLLQE